MSNKKFDIKKEMSKVREEVKNIATSEIEESIIEAKYFINHDKYMFVNNFSIIAIIAALFALYTSIFDDDNVYLKIAVLMSAAFVYGAVFWVIIKSNKSFRMHEIAEYKIGLLQKRLDLATEVKVETDLCDYPLTIEERFHQAGIPISEIDRELVDLIDVLNFRLGLQTRHSCYGHVNGLAPFIEFDKSVSDDRISHLVEYLSIKDFGPKWFSIENKADFGSFNKRIRHEDDEISVTWVYEYPSIDMAVSSEMYNDLKCWLTNQLVNVLHDYADEYSVKVSQRELREKTTPNGSFT